jgi:crotonobetaine/carnitine-CoA ligase
VPRHSQPTTRHHGLPPLAQRSVARALQVAAATGPRRTVSDGDETDSLVELLAHARRIAGALAELGLAPGDRVLTMLDNHLDAVRVWFALSLGGFVSVPVNTAARGMILASLVEAADPAVMIVESDLVEELRKVARPERLTPTVVRGPSSAAALPWTDLLDGPPAAEREWDPASHHSVMFTSGSTGGPKGVLVTQAQTYTRAAIVDQRLDGVARQVSLATLPLFHVAGQCRGVLGPLIQGMDVVVRPRFSVSSFWADVRRFEATNTLLMGTTAAYLLRQPPSVDDQDNPLRLVCMAPVTDRAAEFAERFGTRILATYGSTEAGTVSSGETTVPGSLGWVHPEFEARVVGEEGRVVRPGGTGELLLRGTEAHTMAPGYLGREDATAELWRDGWLHTGDLVELRATGELVFTGRSKEVIRRGGENIAPAEVEAIARGVDGVEDCAAVGVPSADGEEDLKLVLVTARPLSAEAVLGELTALLPRYMIPRYLEFTDELPRTPTEKIDKPALRQVTPSTWRAP